MLRCLIFLTLLVVLYGPAVILWPLSLVLGFGLMFFWPGLGVTVLVLGNLLVMYESARPLWSKSKKTG